MAKAKKSKKPPLLTLEQQLVEHDQNAPSGVGHDAYGESYRRQWRRERAQILDQIRHRDAKRAGDGTIEVSADDPDDPKKRRRNSTRCLQSEAWRHNRLDGMQRDAWIEMAKVSQIRAAGSRPTRSSYGPRSGGIGAPPESVALEQTWKDWCVAAVDRRIMIAAVIDCIIEPKTLVDIERDHRMRRGQAMDQFIKGLDLWAQLRGWMREPRMQARPHVAPERAI